MSLLKVIVRKSCHSTGRTRSRRFSRPQVTLYLFLFMRRPLIFPSLTFSFFKNNVFPLFGLNPENLPEETSAEASASVGMDSWATSPVSPLTAVPALTRSTSGEGALVFVLTDGTFSSISKVKVTGGKASFSCSSEERLGVKASSSCAFLTDVPVNTSSSSAAVGIISARNLIQLLTCSSALLLTYSAVLNYLLE